MAPPVRDWSERQSVLEQARMIEAEVMVGDHRVTLVRTSMGTVACVVKAKDPCAGLATIGLGGQSSVLLDAVIAAVPAGPRKKNLAGSQTDWPTPDQGQVQGTRARWSDWHFNPEAGFPMASTTRIQHQGKMYRIALDRFAVWR